MARYYFHLYNGSFTTDQVGLDLPDPAAARAHAIEECREMACVGVRVGRLNLDHHILVTNRCSQQVMKVTFREAFTLEG